MLTKTNAAGHARGLKLHYNSFQYFPRCQWTTSCEEVHSKEIRKSGGEGYNQKVVVTVAVLLTGRRACNKQSGLSEARKEGGLQSVFYGIFALFAGILRYIYPFCGKFSRHLNC